MRLLGLTSHQRKLAAETARSGLLDLLMIRYNAAHRGAETDIFPVTDALGLPVVVYTCLRWGTLLRLDPAISLHRGAATVVASSLVAPQQIAITDNGATAYVSDSR